MMQNSTSRKRSGATVAGIFGLAAVSVLLLCGAGNVPVENFAPQGPMQSDLNGGGHSITNANVLAATNSVSAPVVSAAVSFSSDAGAIGSDGSGDLTVAGGVTMGTISSDAGAIYSDGSGNFFAGGFGVPGGLNGEGLAIQDGTGLLLRAYGGSIAGDYGSWFSDGSGGLTMNTLTSDSGAVYSDGWGDLTELGTLTVNGNFILSSENGGINFDEAVIDLSDGSGEGFSVDGAGDIQANSFSIGGSVAIDSSGNLYSELPSGSILVSQGDGTPTRAAVSTDLSSLIASVPASSTAAGQAGEIACDAGYVYVCVATNTWKRAALSSW